MPVCSSTACANQTYGENCSQSCSPHCGQDKACNNIDGSCISGCDVGYQGKKCDAGEEDIIELTVFKELSYLHYRHKKSSGIGPTL